MQRNVQKIVNRKIEDGERFVLYWQHELSTDIDTEWWLTSYLDCFKWTVSTKLRSYFYQLRSKDLMTNKKLFDMKKRTDPTCGWCQTHIQDITHMLWDCPKIRPIWLRMSHWISFQFDCDLMIERELVFLHDIEAGNKTNIFNLLILITSRYIYTSKLLNSTPNFQGAKNKILATEKMERNIATKNGKLRVHWKKWGELSK